MVLDRLFLWIFTIACLGGTCGIILQVRKERVLATRIEKVYHVMS